MNTISLSVDRDGIYGPTLIKLRTNTSMCRLIDAYCSRNGLNRSNYSFYTNTGVFISDQDTPSSLSLKNNDLIEAVQTSNNTVNSIVRKQDVKQLSINVTDGMSQLTFKIRYDIKMSRVMNIYCSRQGIIRKFYKFYSEFDVEIQDDDTPFTLSMNDGDNIYIRPVYGWA